MLLLVFCLFVLSQALDIVSFDTPADPSNYPNYFYLTVYPADSKTIFLKAQGEGAQNPYGTQVWPNATLVNNTATWDVRHDSGSGWGLARSRTYTLWASTDGKVWGNPFVIFCCDMVRPPNQKTLVLQGWVNETVYSDEKVVIGSNAILAIGVGVHTM
jgi:hypothetical protein